MLRSRELLVLLSLCVAACGLDETGASPGSGGASGSGTGGGSGGTGSGASGGTTAGGAGGSAGAPGGASGSGGADAGNDTGVDSGSDATLTDSSPDGADAGDAAGDAGLTTALHGARLELPCAGVLSSVACSASAYSKTFPFEGQLGVTYDVTLRFRGVVEENGYTCATKVGAFCTGGTPTAAGWNVFSIKVADPPQIYHLNAGAAGVTHCWPIDYQATLPIKGNASIELNADANDGQQVRNFDAVGTPIVVLGVSPAPAAYNGQFIQIDVVSIAQK